MSLECLRRRDPRGARRERLGQEHPARHRQRRGHPDGGAVEIMGRPLTAADPLLARRLGLATVYQDNSLVRELTVAQNLYLGAARRCASLSAAMQRMGRERLLAAYDLDIAPDALVGDSDAGGAPVPRDRQGARPPSRRSCCSTSRHRRLDLAGVEKALGASSAGSPPKAPRSSMSAIACPRSSTLADRVTILRDGIGQGTYDDQRQPLGKGPDRADGRPARSRPSIRQKRQADLEAAGVCFWAAGFSGGTFPRTSISHVHRGEILGFAGAEGNGQRDVIRALGGLRGLRAAICLRRPAGCRRAAPREAFDAGTHVPQRRPLAGIDFRRARRAREHDAAGARPIRLRRAWSRRARSEAQRAALVEQTRRRRRRRLDQPISGLSGGNQQKVGAGAKLPLRRATWC